MRLKKHFWVLFIGILATLSLRAQNESEKFRVAKAYFEAQELNKAEDAFSELLKKDPTNYTYYSFLFQIEMRLSHFEAAEKMAKAMSKKVEFPQLYWQDAAFALKKIPGKAEKAEKQYDELINKLKANNSLIVAVAEKFDERSEFDFALKTYKKGLQLLGDNPDIRLKIAEYQGKLGKKQEMIDELIGILSTDLKKLEAVESQLQNQLSGNLEWDLLRISLLKKSQKDPENQGISELFIWYYLQKKDYRQALILSKALVKRLNEDGSRIFALAKEAEGDGDIMATISILEDYLTLGKTASLYMQAKMELLQLRKDQLLAKPNSDTIAYALKNEYQTFFYEFGYQLNNISIQKEYARFLAFRLEQIDTAISLMENALSLPGIQRLTAAEIKLELGDFYLMNGDEAESALTYGQVDKGFKEDAIGREAKFRNARLSFFQGDFEWAQGQLDVLKAATSQKISNDAIFLSMLIQDNLGLDSNFAAMELFALADRFAFRLKIDSALYYFNQLALSYTGHSITDESWFACARMYERAMRYEDAALWYQKIVSGFASEIWADDALFRLGMIYTYPLKNPIEGKKYFEKLLEEYPNSTFAVEARKQFRQLRGDAQENLEKLEFSPFDTGWSL
jgi:hypothetical protein